MKKLHLGCYNKKISGYINIDIRPDVNPDVVDDIATLNQFEPNTIDIIYNCHVLEHFDKNEYLSVLQRWYELLKVGGTLRISVPDMNAVCEYYIQEKSLDKLYSFFWGSQRHPYDYHKYGWNFESLKKDLLSIGFSSVKPYDWRQTDHADLDDYSQAYLPHMDKENGKLMSLNVEAVK